MRNLGAIVGILLGIVSNAWQDRSTGSSIALQLVRDDPEWLLALLALTAQQSTKEPLGCTLITSRLQQNINHITILIHGTPKILLLAVDSDEEFVQIPGITEAPLFHLKTSGIVGSEFPAPLADSFIRNNDSALKFSRTERVHSESYGSELAPILSALCLTSSTSTSVLEKYTTRTRDLAQSDSSCRPVRKSSLKRLRHAAKRGITP
jgi:hypothetical protein